MAILEKAITVCTFLLSSYWCDGFSEHLDLALAPNKTNGGIKKQWNTQLLRADETDRKLCR